MVHACGRLLFHHAARHVHHALPRVVEHAARWLAKHPAERAVVYYWAHVLAFANALEEAEVTARHGRFACQAIACATVQGATATQAEALCLRGMPWQEALLSLHLRRRA